MISALLAGIDIEELYIVFAEGHQTFQGGLPPDQYEVSEKKVRRIVQFLVDVGCPTSLARRIEEAGSAIHRVGDPFPDGLDVAGFLRRTMAVGAELSELMSEVREHLGDHDGQLYDAGVMLARLHLCVRVLCGSQPAVSEEEKEFVDIYRAELERVVPIAAGFVAAIQSEQALYRQLDEPARYPITRVAGQLEDWSGWSETWCRRTRAYLDEAFAAFGMIDIEASVSSSDAERERSTIDDVHAIPDRLTETVDAERARARDLLMRGDFVEAERIQLQLIDRCRRVVQPNDPLILQIRGDLCWTLLGSGRMELAVAAVNDLADDCALTYGERDPITAFFSVRGLIVLRSTGNVDLFLEFSKRRLAWLAEEDPRGLPRELRGTQRELLRLLAEATGPGQPAVKPHRRRHRGKE